MRSSQLTPPLPSLHSCSLYPSIFFLAFFFYVYLFFERESTSRGGAEREGEGDTESEAGSRLRAISPEPDAGLELTDCKIVT